MGKSLRQSRSVSVLAGVSLVLAASVPAAPRDSSPLKRILVLGDSLSGGFGLKSRQAWPALITEKLNTVGFKEFEITNASETGGTTGGGLQRLPLHLKRKIDIFILELRINDAFRRVPTAEIRNNL